MEEGQFEWVVSYLFSQKRQEIQGAKLFLQCAVSVQGMGDHVSQLFPIPGGL